jgi:hypothetical protein
MAAINTTGVGITATGAGSSGKVVNFPAKRHADDGDRKKDGNQHGNAAKKARQQLKAKLFEDRKQLPIWPGTASRSFPFIIAIDWTGCVMNSS